ncbi:hypothetical protein C8J57DRAFT_1470310 [Mycena rebaudengoi]|nr:hypothetical protein C8J57DRAFT_1470310 [Mycena rebaudengoi]
MLKLMPSLPSLRCQLLPCGRLLSHGACHLELDSTRLQALREYQLYAVYIDLYSPCPARNKLFGLNHHEIHELSEESFRSIFGFCDVYSVPTVGSRRTFAPRSKILLSLLVRQGCCEHITIPLCMEHLGRLQSLVYLAQPDSTMSVRDCDMTVGLICPFSLDFIAAYMVGSGE